MLPQLLQQPCLCHPLPSHQPWQEHQQQHLLQKDTRSEEACQRQEQQDKPIHRQSCFAVVKLLHAKDSCPCANCFSSQRSRTGTTTSCQQTVIYTDSSKCVLEQLMHNTWRSSSSNSVVSQVFLALKGSLQCRRGFVSPLLPP